MAKKSERSIDPAASLALATRVAAVVAEAGGPPAKRKSHPDAIQIWGTEFSGPIPPPEILLEYEKALPGLAERIVRMAEEEGRHRREAAARVIRLAELGMASALVIALTIIGCGTYAAVHGSEMAGLASVLAAVAGLVVVFVTGRAGALPARPPGEGGEPRER